MIITFGTSSFQIKRTCYSFISTLYRSTTIRSFSQLSATNMEITPSKHPKPMVEKKGLKFGHHFSDHMLYADWDRNLGWGKIHISELDDFSMKPSSMVFHYGGAVFEGLKAYRDDEGNVRLFRPEMNAKRLLRSSERIGLPSFDIDEFLVALKRLVLLEKRWIFPDHGYSLYLRPCIISTHDTLGVGRSDKARLFIICSPVGPYYPNGFKPVSLLADEFHVRAFPGGVGEFKFAGNYAPTILPQTQAAAKGYDQILWLFGKEYYITEAGTMNFFCYWKNEDGENELVTAPLNGTILPGVTRDSIINLIKQWKDIKVSERSITVPELIKAQQENRIKECFGCGTAAIVSPIKNIGFKGKDYPIPVGDGDCGPLTLKIMNSIQDIQYGKVPHEWSIKLIE